MSLGNQLMSALNTDYRASLYPQVGTPTGFAVSVSACAFQNPETNWCACQNTFSCGETGGFYSLDYDLQNIGIFASNDSQLELPLPGFVSGCIPLESLLASSLECLYNTSCIVHFSRSQSATEQLDPTQTSQYSINSTIEELLEQLMLEQWTPNISFSAFFAQCNATSCNYTVTAKNSPVYVLTVLLGLYGGLTASLRLIVPHIVSILFTRSCKRNNAAEIPSLTSEYKFCFLFTKLVLL
jgi:hypothetical protein